MQDWNHLCLELETGLTEEQLSAIDTELALHTGMIRSHLAAGARIPSHIEGAAAVGVPIVPFTHPDELFASAGGTVADEEYELIEYPDYWMTVHHSDIPVVMLLPKKQGAKMHELCRLIERCEVLVGSTLDIKTGMYLQWNSPGFRWTLHKDDEFDGVFSRVHVPLTTNQENQIRWRDEAGRVLLDRQLQRGKVYWLRTDVLHESENRSLSEPRLHLIIDVNEPCS
jgi:hypothetical protein